MSVFGLAHIVHLIWMTLLVIYMYQWRGQSVIYIQGASAIILYALVSWASWESQFVYFWLIAVHVTFGMIFIFSSRTMPGYVISVCFFLMFGADVLLYHGAISQETYPNVKGLFSHVIMAALWIGAFYNAGNSFRPWVAFNDSDSGNDGMAFDSQMDGLRATQSVEKNNQNV